MDWAGLMIGIAAAGLVAFFLLLVVCALCACVLSSEISQEEEKFTFTKNKNVARSQKGKSR